MSGALSKARHNHNSHAQFSGLTSPAPQLSLLDYDAITCGEEWTVVEKRGFGAALLIHLVWFVLMVRHL
jgi:hypothetical protein